MDPDGKKNRGIQALIYVWQQFDVDKGYCWAWAEICALLLAIRVCYLNFYYYYYYLNHFSEKTLNFLLHFTLMVVKVEVCSFGEEKKTEKCNFYNINEIIKPFFP